MSKKNSTGQTKNPRSGHYVKIDRKKGKIISHKKSEGPYKNVPIIRKRDKWLTIIQLMVMFIQKRLNTDLRLVL